jgi:hypothetical protein
MEFGSFVIVAMMVLFVAAVVKARRRRTGGPGPGATGSIYELLSEDRRNAIEIIA